MTAEEYAGGQVERRLTTGSADVDKALGGGIETGSVTEIFGGSRTGKSQFCFTLAVTCQLASPLGGGEGKCLYIHTDGKFSTTRLVQIAERFKVKNVLKNVVLCRVRTTIEQLQAVEEARVLLTGSRFALVIVDSATALYRAEYAGRSQLSGAAQWFFFDRKIIYSRFSSSATLVEVPSMLAFSGRRLRGRCRHHEPSRSSGVRWWWRRRRRWQHRRSRSQDSPLVARLPGAQRRHQGPFVAGAGYLRGTVCYREGRHLELRTLGGVIKFLPLLLSKFFFLQKTKITRPFSLSTLFCQGCENQIIITKAVN